MDAYIGPNRSVSTAAGQASITATTGVTQTKAQREAQRYMLAALATSRRASVEAIVGR